MISQNSLLMEVFQEIENYLLDRMSEEEQKAFEAEMSQNLELRRKVDSYREIIEGIRLVGESRTIDKISQWEKSLASTPSGSSKRILISRTQWYGIAAAIALIACLSFFLLIPGKPKYEALFDKFYSIQENDISIMGSEDKAEALRDGLKAYDRRDFKKAAQHLEDFLKKYPDSLHIRFFYALANMELGEYDEAVQSLIPISEDPHSLRERAQWYEALGNLRQNNIERTQEILEIITSDSDHSYYKIAKALSEEL